MYWAPILHFYEPPTQFPAVLNDRFGANIVVAPTSQMLDWRTPWRSAASPVSRQELSVKDAALMCAIPNKRDISAAPKLVGMRVGEATMKGRVLWFSLVAAAVLVAPGEATDAAQDAPPASIVVSDRTRLLVIAPHPDDEMLSAGGLMQRVGTVGGRVRIVYLTDGDGFPEGVKVHDRVVHPTAADYRGYGQLRKREATQAIASLAIRTHELTFLGFPDGALSGLMTKFWSNRRRPFQSPYTRQHRPSTGEAVATDPHYRGEDLTQELALVIGVFRPTMIVVPRKEDQHPDHCTASYFIDNAVGDVTRVDPAFHVDVFNYLVHYNDWTWANDSDELSPPADLDGGSSGWIVFALSPGERQNKHTALTRYESQMHVMSWFLHTFARANELFSRPTPGRNFLPLPQNPCV